MASQSGNGSGRLGLLGIQERLGMVGGNFKVESAPERGATLLVRIPITKADEKEKKAKQSENSRAAGRRSRRHA
jgi:signal transduction histidine kinase